MLEHLNFCYQIMYVSNRRYKCDPTVPDYHLFLRIVGLGDWYNDKVKMKNAPWSPPELTEFEMNRYAAPTHTENT